MDLQDNSEMARQEIQRRLVAGLNRANRSMIEDAQAGAPVKSGNLRDNTEVTQEASAEDPIAMGASKALYARRVNRDDKPFWTVARLKMRDKFGSFFHG